MLSIEQHKLTLSALVGRESLESLAAGAGVSAEEVKGWIRAYLKEKADLGPAQVKTAVRGGAEIVRDTRGVPHVYASDAYDLFYALGFAQAQDRLWQLDYLRRMSQGRLSEVLGRKWLDSDVAMRTVHIAEIAERTAGKLGAETALAMGGFADGVNAWMKSLPAGLPIEFELLGYEPEPWRLADCLVVLRRWWWQLTGRLYVLWISEFVRAVLKDDRLYEAFYTPAAPTAYVVPPGFYDPTPKWPGGPADPALELPWGTADPVGSNNWAVADDRAARSEQLMEERKPHSLQGLAAIQSVGAPFTPWG